MTTVTAHGATISVDSSGVHVERTPMGQTLLPPTLDVSPADLRGWYHHAPTATSPGWIQFSLAGGSGRPLRGYPATHGATTVVAFAPGQQDAFVAANAALTALQGGYPVDGPGTDDGDASSAESPLSLFELPEVPAAEPAPSDKPKGGKGGRAARAARAARGAGDPGTASPPRTPCPSRI
jgi:DNA polymerase-3 subunit epsilon